MVVGSADEVDGFEKRCGGRDLVVLMIVASSRSTTQLVPGFWRPLEGNRYLTYYVCFWGIQLILALRMQAFGTDTQYAPKLGLSCVPFCGADLVRSYLYKEVGIAAAQKTPNTYLSDCAAAQNIQY